MLTFIPNAQNGISKARDPKREELKKLLFDSRTKAVDLGRMKILLQKVDLAERQPPDGCCFLHIAVVCKVPENVLQLIVDIYNEKEISFNIENRDHRTSLDCAFMSGYMPGIRILVRQEGIEIHRPMHEAKIITYYQYFQEKFPEASKEIKDYLEPPPPTFREVLFNSIGASCLWMFNNKQPANYQAIPQHLSNASLNVVKPRKQKKDD